MNDHDEPQLEPAAHGGRSVVFQGASVMELYERLSIIGPNVALVRFTLKGHDGYIDVIGEGYSGPPINESKPCPGSPGCP